MIHVTYHGSLCLVGADNEDAPAFDEWTREHIASDAVMWAGQVVVEPRYVEALVEGIRADGFEVVGY